MCAVEFVLSREFSTISPQQRGDLLYGSTGQRALSASVKIIFDNKNGRLPIKKVTTTSHPY